jgi:hypothetical protein
MVLGEPSRTIYLRTKENLKLSDDRLWPASVAAQVANARDPALAGSQVTRRQFSLLRTVGDWVAERLRPRPRDDI